MANVVNEILDLVRRMRLVEGMNYVNGDTTTFSQAQNYAKKKYGDFNDAGQGRLYDEKSGKFWFFYKLKEFMKEILYKKILISPKFIDNDLHRLYHDDNDEDSQQDIMNKEAILKSLQHTLSTSVQNNLLGDVFEGLLLKAKDFNQEADLKCGIELKTTQPGTRVLTLFKRSISNEFDFSNNLNQYIESLNLESPTIDVKFEKTVVNEKEVGDGMGSLFGEFDRDNETYNYRKAVGIVHDGKNIISRFYLNVTFADDALMYAVEAVSDNGSEILYETSFPYESDGEDKGLLDIVKKKIKNVFHVTGKIGNDEQFGKYAMFTGYESMILREDFDLYKMFTSGVIKPFFRATFTNEKVQDNKPAVNRELSGELNFQQPMNEEEDFQDEYPMDGNQNFNTMVKSQYGRSYFNSKYKSELKIYGVVFKMNLASLYKVYDIDKE